MQRIEKMLNFYQLSLLNVPEKRGRPAKLETMITAILKFKRYAKDEQHQAVQLKFLNTCLYSGLPFLSMSFIWTGINRILRVTCTPKLINDRDLSPSISPINHKNVKYPMTPVSMMASKQRIESVKSVDLHIQSINRTKIKKTPAAPRNGKYQIISSQHVLSTVQRR